MDSRLVQMTLLFVCVTISASVRDKRYSWVQDDISEYWSTFSADRLPRRPNGEVDTAYLPSVGNGRLGFVPFSKTIHMAGLYNGRDQNSHLAHIPALGAFDIDFENMGSIDRLEKYTLNVEKGFFEKKIEIPRYGLQAYLRVYASADRNLRGVIVHEVTMVRGSYKGSIYITTSMTGDEASPDFLLEREDIGIRKMRVMGRLSEPGDDVKATSRRHLYMYYNYPRSIGLRTHEQKVTLNFIMAIAETDRRARSDYEFARGLREDSLMRLQISAWASIWEGAHIKITGNHELMKLTASSLYYLYSSLPEHRAIGQTGVGVGTNGLVNSANITTSNGHVTWEQEKWLFPVALLFYPKKARSMLQYRADRVVQAEENAARLGWKGAKFPWQSAGVGDEVTSSNCGLCGGERRKCSACDDVTKYGDHVTSDVAHAVRQYLAVTYGNEWLSRGNGVQMLRSIAEYFASRATFNQDLLSYEIKNVMGPDLYERDGAATIVSNSLYTNMGAAAAMETASYAACVEGSNPQGVPHAWLGIARNLHYPINEKKRYFEPYDKYDDESSSRTFQLPGPITADYHLSHNLSKNLSIVFRANNLAKYVPLIDHSARAYTWSSVVIAYLDINNRSAADRHFNRVFRGYTRQPFWVWTDSQDYSRWSSSNYLPGAAAFLQSLIFGYAGVKILPQKLEFHPHTPPLSKQMRINGIKYKGASFDLLVTSSDDVIGRESVTFMLVDNPHGRQFVIELEEMETEREIHIGVAEMFPCQRFSLRLLGISSKGCDLPHDPSIEFHPWRTVPNHVGDDVMSKMAASASLVSVSNFLLIAALAVSMSMR